MSVRKKADRHYFQKLMESDVWLPFTEYKKKMGQYQSNQPMEKERTIWIIAGETSGDQYGARVAEALRCAAPDCRVKGMGGVAMDEAGVEIMVDSTELGVIGFIEVLKHLSTFKRIFKDLVKRAAEERPDAVVLIDYPGFNVRLARELKKLGIKVVYYVSPQVWAWGKKRLKTLPQIVDKLLVIFPFEVDVWKDTGLETRFVGHPMIELLNEKRMDEPRDENTVLLLPGSRFNEIDRLLGPILASADRLWQEQGELKFVLVTPREAIRKHVLQAMEEAGYEFPLEVTCGDSHYWLQKATAGIASSGTVTVQAAILGLPLVSIYRVSPVSYWMFKMLVKLDFFTMVNIITKWEVFQEFLQSAVSPDNLVPALKAIMPGGNRREEVLSGMAEMVKLLGGEASVSDNVAREVLSVISAED